MQHLQLNEHNTAFVLHGSEERRSLYLHRVLLEEVGSTVKVLELLVLDEKDTVIYTQSLWPSDKQREVAVDKRFVFYEHFTVCLRSEPEGAPFRALVAYE